MAIPPSALDTKNLTDAINKLTQTLGQNNSTMRDLVMKESALSRAMKNVSDMGDDLSDSMIKQDLALGLAVKSLTSTGKGIGKLASMATRKISGRTDYEKARRAGIDDEAIRKGVGLKFAGVNAKRAQKYQKKLEKKGIPGGPSGSPGGLPGGVPGGPPAAPIAAPASPLGGMDLAPDLSTSAKAGFGIAAVGVGIAGFIAALALGGSAVNAVGGASGIKDMLSAVGEGLSTFNTQSLVGFGSLLAVGGIFGAVAGAKSAASVGFAADVGMTMIGLGIGGFFAALSLGAAGAAALGGPAAVKDMLTALGEGLGSFDTKSLAAFGGMLGTGALFGAVPGLGALAAGTAALGMTAIGLGIGGFFTGLATGGAAVKQLGGGAVIKDMIVGLGEGLASFNEVKGGNILKAGTGLTALAAGLGALAVGDTIGKIMDFFTGGSTEDSTIIKVAKSLIVFEEVDGENLKNIGDGISALASGLLTLASLPKIDTKNLSQTAATLGAMNGINIPSAPGGGGGGLSTPMDKAGVAPGPLPGGVRGILEQISRGEGTSDEAARKRGLASGYDVSLGYGAYGGGPDKPLSEMTLEEVQAYQKKMLADPKNTLNSSAVGKYQVISGTLKDAMKDLQLDPTQKFDQQTQDKIGEYLLKRRGLDKLQKGQISPEEFQLGLSKEFASVADPRTGMGYYAGQRTAHTTSAQIQAAISGLQGDNLNMASTSVENAAAAPGTIVVNAPQQVAPPQQPKAQAAAPAISPGRPSHASVAGANYRGFQVSDISA